AQWQPLGVAQTIASFKPGIPKILEWDFTPSASASEHACLLAVIDSASDPIPPGNKVFDIRTLIATDKRIGLKNLHILDPKRVSAPSIASGILSFGLKGGQPNDRAHPAWGNAAKGEPDLLKTGHPDNSQSRGLAAKEPSQALLQSLS